MENRAKLVTRIENITVFLTGIFFLIFPLFILTLTTEGFNLPKQAVLSIVVLAGVLLLGIKAVLNNGVKLRRTPFDLPIVLLLGAALISSILSLNRYDSLIILVPFLFAGLLYFVVTNSVKRQQDFLFITGSLIVGAIGVSLITTLSYFKIFILPFDFAKFQNFTPFGSIFDQTIYLALVFVLCIYLAWPSIKRRAVDKSRAIYLVGGFFVLIGLVVSLVGLTTLPKEQTGLQLLPMQTGFQTAFASISQDQGRVIQGLLSGSGYGTYVTDFTRFKPASFNNLDSWNLTFFRSSSFFLELLATTGLLGILSFLFLAYRIIRSKPLFAPLIAALALAFLVPFAYTVIVLFFALLAIYAAQQGLSERNKTRFFDVELKLLSLKKGVLALDSPTSRRESEYGNLLPFLFLGLTILFVAFFGFNVGRFFYSDYLFQQSLIAANRNDIQKTYDLQLEAINKMPERSDLKARFAALNLNLANNFASSIPQGASPSAEQQQTIYQLIQTSINSGREATRLSPLNTGYWQNLSGIYRSLIGFGENADQFSLLAAQQALILDPNNPQQYINYGGIFYQLGQWDNAIRQFQIAASLKPDFANAYYNLGHALEQKGDLEQALIQYQRVRSLVANDAESKRLIEAEITALQDKIGSNQQAVNTPTEESNEEQPPLGISRPNAQLPEQDPEVSIAPPQTSVTPSKTPSPTPTRAPLAE